ncbi:MULTISPECIES: hypothetical protein [Shinella]|jgi:hypothetical protein|uniref:Uncharacterized protein n=1 Tax=Shinella granuli TaxID=323621 RepID=A0A4R2D1T1_SHIGR|nr:MULTISPECIES: hypothetical protein [Shinella]TCN47741.1 hypothetical protein EV665_102261 [Shinella granuli]
MKTRKTDTRPETDLATRYNPIGIRAVVAAALMSKVRRAPRK